MLVGLSLLGAVACGAQTPTAVDATDPADTSAAEAGTADAGTESAPATGAASVDDVYAELGDLAGEERRERLVEIASEEEGTLRVYTSMNTEEIQPVVDAFKEDTGLEALVYRASNEDVLKRVLEEHKAAFDDGADVILNNAPEMELASREGLLAPLDSPATEGIGVVEDDWAAANLLVYLTAWNVNTVPSESVPSSMEDALAHEGPLAYQYEDTLWFATLVTEWYMNELGMTEREAVEEIKAGLSEGARIVDGHTLGANLLASGEYDVASSLYHHTLVQMIEDGAPLAWEPAIEPLIVNSLGVGMHKETGQPAGALLLAEYMLTDMQQMLPEFGRTPALEGAPGGLPAEYDPIPVRLDLYIDNREHWEGLNLEVVNAIGGEILAE